MSVAALSTGSRRLIYSTRATIAVYPSIYLPYARGRYARQSDDRVVSSDTQLVIEGFQRSGNTFAVVAFESAQPAPVKIAHHLHAAAQIVAATRMGIPTIVLIRDPEDSVLSHMIRAPGISAHQALANWVRFYEHVIPYGDRVVTASFDQVTADFGEQIRRVNERFGTDFVEFDHTDDNVSRCFSLIEQRNRARYGTIEETKIARPSVERGSLKRALRRQYEATELAALRRRATTIFRTLASPSTAN